MNITAWWKALSVREQRLTMIASVALIVGLFYWGLWQPLQLRAEQADSRLQNQKASLQWLQEQASEIVTLRGQTGTSAQSNKGLNQVVNETTGRFDIELIRMQPRDNAVQVWVKPISFNALVDWLAFLQRHHGVAAQFLDISKTDVEGMVEVNRLQLGRG